MIEKTLSEHNLNEATCNDNALNEDGELLRILSTRSQRPGMGGQAVINRRCISRMLSHLKMPARAFA
ncbi:hypothetical protein [Orrella marina]|uniref:Uncharacterized protein n=1 Tax=Orrella marina TaxID=2163011 RepID=A0A2R4XF69_9BURK|nr:hypothetical protein [Orrella marina]AWB32438.1 hypothetical protein DBV39_00500 [Orrella marina]